MAARTIRMQVRRQDTPASSGYWEEYEIPHRPRENVVSVLMEIAKDPRTRDGKRTSPVVYDRSCLEEVCGSCAMRVNGAARMACTALIDSLEQPIRLEPLAKFPVVRDLSVDRGSMRRSVLDPLADHVDRGLIEIGPALRHLIAEERCRSAFELLDYETAVGITGDHTDLGGVAGDVNEAVSTSAATRRTA